MIPRHFVFAALMFAAQAASSFGAAAIERVTRLTLAPTQYGRVDFVVILQAEWKDPFAAAEVRLDLEITDPAGQTIVVPGYFEAGESGHSSVWRVRYAPRAPGLHRGQVALTMGAVRTVCAVPEFSVGPAAPDRHGFLHSAGPWCLRFDDHTPFRGLGENLGWESRSSDDSKFFKTLHEQPRFNYAYLLARLGSAGGNFFRTWMCAWNLPLEWPRVTDTQRYGNHPGARFNPDASARLDELLELAEASGTYVMLTLDPHGSFLGSNWELNPYNRRNGGPAATPMDFFTEEKARTRYRDRLRYLVARWGFSSHLAVWEFFNEIDHVVYDRKPQPIPDAIITAWHEEMSAELRRLDPYGRPITTSISHRPIAGLDAVAAIDFHQRHIYRNTDSLPNVIRAELQRTGKPEVIGEYGYEWDWTKDFNGFASEMDADFKRGLWLGLFSPTPIVPLSWWWEFFDERGVTDYLAGVRAVSDRMLAAGHGEFVEVTAHAGLARTLAVRCGQTVFVYLQNSAATTETVTLELAGTWPQLSEVAAFDPESRVWSEGPAVQATAAGLRLRPLALRAGEIRIVVLR